ncbi:esterase [Salmonella enterica subsp. enterica]|nr:esterase [Salmonella enterica subsp. enterica] [Salmonella enterica subsp. enterica serovar Menston]
MSMIWYQNISPALRICLGDKIKGKDKLRIIDILHHVAGFPADPQYPNKTSPVNYFHRVKALLWR